jgi:putative heme-binding domain-containing protein
MNNPFFVLMALLLICCEARADESNQTDFFLPRNPVAAAYVLGRLSNRELIDAPRSEFVYVALLERKGLERKYRLEALNGLATIRHTSQLEELLKGLGDLDKKGQDSEGPLLDLAAILLQSDRAALAPRLGELHVLATESNLPITRRIAWAASVAAEPPGELTWRTAEANPTQLPDLVGGIALLPQDSMRDGFYGKVKPFLRPDSSSGLIQAAAAAIVTMHGHQEETFQCLVALVEADVQTPTAIAALARIPRSAWPKPAAGPLSQSLLEHLKKIPPEHRADPSFGEALQFANDLVSLLPPEAELALRRALRNLGPTVVTLHAVYEQMRFDKDRIIAEPGKPLVIFLQNDDAMPHNLAILAPGALQEIGLAAEKMSPEPDSEGRLYVPALPKVLHATPLVSPGRKLQLAFDAPARPGDYPFACTFPGHWLRMSGTLTVVPDTEAYLANHPLSEQPKLTEWKIADFSSELSDTNMVSNPDAGRELFTKLACSQCHKLGSQGYAYGPDLTEVFKRYKNDRAAVLDQILEPSKLIEDRYRNFNFELKEGDSLLGMVLKEDEQNLTIQTGPADSLIQTLKKSDVQRRRVQSSSPMPVGLLNALSKNEILDLLAYLESGGNAPVHEHTR